MKRSNLLAKATIFMALSGLGAGCATEADVGTAEDEIIVTPILTGPIASPGIIITPFLPLTGTAACNALTFSILSPTLPLSFIAVDGIGVSSLDLALFSIGADNALISLGITASHIDAALLTSIRTGLPFGIVDPLTPDLLLDGMITGLDPLIQSSLIDLVGLTTLDTIGLRAATRLALDPMITDTALVFTGLDTILTFPLSLAIGTSFINPIFPANLNIFVGTPAGFITSALFPVPFNAACGVGLPLLPILPIAPLPMTPIIF